MEHGACFLRFTSSSGTFTKLFGVDALPRGLEAAENNLDPLKRCRPLSQFSSQGFAVDRELHF